MRAWLNLARRRDVVVRAVRVALVVGTLLIIINYADRAIANNLTGVDLIKMAITYLVPYAVSTYSAVGALRAQQLAQADNR
ncbi:MAG: nitrate/nitrite transporter NrtS [Chromatiales bacterium]|jgi:hypothetical protein|nr:nitrate/nitrite transporter NrtS [Chromatiales bacterium]